VMSDKAGPNRNRVTIALIAMAFAVVGALWLFNKPRHDAEPVSAVATNCSRFAVDAQKLFQQGDTATLGGTFAPGDHVHLAIDFSGLRYRWELSGALAAEKVVVTGSGSFTSYTESTVTDTTVTPYMATTDYTFESTVSAATSTVSTSPSPTSTAFTSTTFTTAHGTISGRARLELDVDVIKADDGAITINKTRSVPLFMPPRVVSASCTAATQASTRPTT